jgi:hypothetical protein
MVTVGREWSAEEKCFAQHLIAAALGPLEGWAKTGSTGGTKVSTKPV